MSISPSQVLSKMNVVLQLVMDNPEQVLYSQGSSRPWVCINLFLPVHFV